jgi:hypothetical protein
MDTSLRTSTSTVSRQEPGESQGPANERGVEQQGGTSSKLASLKTALAGQPGIHQGAQSLTDTLTSLREDVGSHKTLGRFKNAVAEKLPFVGKTTYGRILQQADAYAANAPNARLCTKVDKLEGLKRDIDAWRQSHGGDGSKAKAIAKLDTQLTRELMALRTQRDQQATARLQSALPVIAQPVQSPGATIDKGGAISGQALQRIQHVLGSDAFTRAKDGTPKNEDSGQGLPVSEVFKKDFIGRHAPLDLYDGDKHIYDREAKKAGNAGTALLKLTRDPQTATALSHYLGQHMMAALEAGKLDLLKGPNDRLNIMLDGQQTFSHQVRRNPPDKEGGEVTYTIDYTITNPVGHLGNGPDDHLAFKPGSEMQLAMQLTVKESDLRAGNGAFTVTGQPSYQLHLEPDIAGIVHPRSL